MPSNSKDNHPPSQALNRRTFVKSSVAGAAAVALTSPAIALSSPTELSAPAIATASKTGSEKIVGTGDHKFKIDHDWAKLPADFTWQTTHNVAVDKAQNLYVIHEGRKNQKDHPSIFVFDKNGKYIKSFGKQFQGGGHGIEVREEGGKEYLYVAIYLDLKCFAKLDLDGEVIWQNYAPVECGAYKANEEKPSPGWGRNRFLPTNFAFIPDSDDFFLVDGYGSYLIHRYTKDGKYIKSFGGQGKDNGKFNLPHGIWVDNRGKEPELVICDRANNQLQFLDLEGKHKRTMKGFGLPANIDIHKNLMLVPELHARVTLLDENNKVVAQLGEDVKRVTTGNNIRGSESKWLEGKFVHPHDACFDGEGNIFVAEWVQSGRVSKLTRV